MNTGKADSGREVSDASTDRFRRGIGGGMREEGDSSNTGSPVGGAHAPTGNPRGPAWAGGVAERLVVPEKLGNAGGGKEPQFESSARRKQGHGDWWKRLIAPEAFGHSRRRYMRKPFVGDGMISSESRVRENRPPGCASSKGWRVQRGTDPPGKEPEPRSLDGKEEGN